MSITEVYSSSSNGGSLNIIGIPCQSSLPSTFTDPASAVLLECSHTLLNNEQIVKRAM
jgi:hypothetical protein